MPQSYGARGTLSDGGVVPDTLYNIPRSIDTTAYICRGLHHTCAYLLFTHMQQAHGAHGTLSIGGVAAETLKEYAGIMQAHNTPVLQVPRTSISRY